MQKNNLKYRRYFRLMLVLLLAATALAAALAGLTYSRYVVEWTPGRTAAQAKDFYFASDLLSEGDAPVYQLANFVPGQAIAFQLRNYADELRVSQTDISYAVAASGLAGLSGTLVAGKTPVNQTVELMVDGTRFENGKATVLVEAETTAPYSQKLSAVFELYQSISNVSYQVSDSAGSNTLALTITTADESGTVNLTFPSNVLPDNTDHRLTLGTGTTLSINVNSKAQYTIIFFKNNPNAVFGDSNFSIS